MHAVDLTLKNRIMKLYLFDVTKGVLYALTQKRQIDKFLRAYPDWFDHESDTKEMEDVKAYFKTHGKIVASEHNKTCLSTY